MTGGTSDEAGGPRFTPGAIPAWIRYGYTAWMIVWTTTIFQIVGPANFLWLCDVANFVLLLAVWSGSALLFSSQATGILIIQCVWILDVLGRILMGFHPIGGTEYMFDPAEAVLVRALSTFHVWVPLLVLWAVRRRGYDPRGWRLQAAITAVLLPACLLTDPELNLNWIYRPFGIEQTLLPPAGWVLACIVLYPLVLYLPTHALLARWARRGGFLLR